MTSPPVTAWTPSSFHLLATTRAGCYLHSLPEIPLYRVFRGASRSIRILCSKMLSLYFVLNVFCIAVCFLGRRFLRFFSDTVRIIFRESQSGKPALTGGLHPNAHFSFPGPLGQVRPEPRLECHCTVSLLFFTRIVFGRRILH